jgi:hypothetical protein
MDSKYLRLPSKVRFPSPTSDRISQFIISNHFLAVGTSYSTLGVTGDNTLECSTIKQQYRDLHSQDKIKGMIRCGELLVRFGMYQRI